MGWNATFDEDAWELYDVRADISETPFLAREQPERLAAMVNLWWGEAERALVLPWTTGSCGPLGTPSPK